MPRSVPHSGPVAEPASGTAAHLTLTPERHHLVTSASSATSAARSSWTKPAPNAPSPSARAQADPKAMHLTVGTTKQPPVKQPTGTVPPVKIPPTGPTKAKQPPTNQPSTSGHRTVVPPTGPNPGCTISNKLVPSCQRWFGIAPQTFSKLSPASALSTDEGFSGAPFQLLHQYNNNATLFPSGQSIVVSEQPGANRLLSENWKPATDLTWAQVASASMRLSAGRAPPRTTAGAPCQRGGP